MTIRPTFRKYHQWIGRVFWVSVGLGVLVTIGHALMR
jgi:hypothetical protein